MEPFQTPTADDENPVAAVRDECIKESAEPSHPASKLPREQPEPEHHRPWLNTSWVVAAVVFGLILGIVGTRLFTPPPPEVAPKKTDSGSGIPAPLK